MEYLLGIVVSLVVEGIKKVSKADSFTTHILLFAASIVGAFVYIMLYTSEFWPAVVQVLLVASAFHNLIIRKFY